MSQGESDVSSGGDQPTRNNLADRNGEGLNEPLVYDHFGSGTPEKTQN